MTISVCTLGHGRADHLTNLVRGLAQSERLPDELVIAVLQDAPYDLPDTPFPVRQIAMGGAGLSLAAARNRAAAEARGEALIFLDIDCIPAPALVGDYAAMLGECDGVLMGEVGYLPKGAALDPLDFAALDRLAERHCDRPGPPPGGPERCTDYRCFWSLNFALTAALFTRIGGFDERFHGYGGEDTDFARSCDARGIALWWIRGAKAYHQHHPHHMPPVHHIDSVIANAARFQDKWGEPTMQHWLRAFRLMGLAGRTDDGWERLREVDESDRAFTRQQEDQPYASTRRVVEALLAREAAG